MRCPFLFLPLLATVANLLLALVFNARSSRTKAEQIPAQQEVAESIPAQQGQQGWNLVPAQQEGEDAQLLSTSSCSLGNHIQEYCLDETSNIDVAVASDTPQLLITTSDIGEEQNLRAMPEPFSDFMAYVRPDVSTFYMEKPGTRERTIPEHQGMAGKFINLTPDSMRMYWVGNDGGGVFMGVALPFASYGTGTFPGHRFYFSRTDNPKDKVCEFTVKKGTSVYFCDPYSENDGEEGRAATNESRELNSLNEAEMEKYDALALNLEFGRAYKNFTGNEWLSQYPRNPPVHKMWQADYFGQQHFIHTPETQFQKIPPLDAISQVIGGNNETEPIPLQYYRSQEPLLNITLTAVSCGPRIFEIDNFLSDVEVDHLLALAEEKELPRSSTGNGAGTRSNDSTRTSRNTWLKRESSPVVDAIYRRAADVLGIDEALMRRRQPHEYPELGTRQSIAEDLQLVHYDMGQEYTAHHDFGYPTKTHGDHHSRWANILLYLNDVEEGGETSFPRWINAETSKGLDVKPGKGKAALFYMLNGDGNLDDYSQHAALPVVKGEKWLANLWVWDPVRV